MNYDEFVTHSVPSIFNQGKSMGMGTLESKEFRTSLAQDKTQEALMFTDPMDPENLFTKHINNEKKNNPKPANYPYSDDNILTQQESSAPFCFLESSRYVEYKSRALEVEITHLQLNLTERTNYNVQETSPNSQQYLFNTQKIKRTYSNLFEQINDELNNCSKCYALSDIANLPLVETELEDWLVKITRLGRIKCNLLEFGSSNPQTCCMLQKIKHDMISTQHKIIDCMVQFNLNNGQTSVTPLG